MTQIDGEIYIFLSIQERYLGPLDELISCICVIFLLNSQDSLISKNSTEIIRSGVYIISTAMRFIWLSIDSLII